MGKGTKNIGTTAGLVIAGLLCFAILGWSIRKWMKGPKSHKDVEHGNEAIDLRNLDGLLGRRDSEQQAAPTPSSRPAHPTPPRPPRPSSPPPSSNPSPVLSPDPVIRPGPKCQVTYGLQESYAGTLTPPEQMIPAVGPTPSAPARTRTRRDDWNLHAREGTPPRRNRTTAQGLRPSHDPVEAPPPLFADFQKRLPPIPLLEEQGWESQRMRNRRPQEQDIADEGHMGPEQEHSLLGRSSPSSSSGSPSRLPHGPEVLEQLEPRVYVPCIQPELANGRGLKKKAGIEGLGRGHDM